MIINAYNFRRTCSACPTQFEFETENGEKMYFRYRFGYGALYNLTKDCDYNQPICDFDDGDINSWDGIINEKEFLEIMKNKNVEIFIKTRKLGE